MPDEMSKVCRVLRFLCLQIYGIFGVVWLVGMSGDGCGLADMILTLHTSQLCYSAKRSLASLHSRNNFNYIMPPNPSTRSDLRGDQLYTLT